MLFHSYLFMFVFLPIVLTVFHTVRRRSIPLSMAWLLLASLVYYAWWSPPFAVLLLAACMVNILIARRLCRPGRWFPLATGIAFNLALLGYFKYAVFLSGVWSDATGVEGRLADIVLPLGISFFTFQQITYLNHAKDGKAQTGSLLEHALFSMFFPTMISGPILYQSDIMPRLREKRSGTVRRDLVIGLTIFTLGLFKKVVLAEPLANYADPAFNSAAAGNTITFIEAWGAATTFTFQLYFDFSGYSDMAIGIGRMFGLRLPENFNSPLKSTSIIEFWQRWHMTLTRFLTAYIFNPIVLRLTRARAKARKSLNPAKLGAFVTLLAMPTLFTMALAGIWHGAGWTYAVFGLMHGVLLVLNHAWRITSRKARWRAYVPAGIRTAGAWSLTVAMVMVSFVLFRAQSLDAAVNILTGMAGLDGRMVLSPGLAALLPVAKALIPSATLSALPLANFMGGDQIRWIAAGFIMVLVLPNTQEWMARYYPVTSPVRRPPGLLLPRFAWRPTGLWAIAVIGLLAVSLVMALNPTEFLYSHF